MVAGSQLMYSFKLEEIVVERGFKKLKFNLVKKYMQESMTQSKVLNLGAFLAHPEFGCC